MGYKTNARGWKGRDDLIPLVCTNCGKPFNCPPFHLDYLVDPARVFHPMCFYGGKWRQGLTPEMRERIESNRKVLEEYGYQRKTFEEIEKMVLVSVDGC